MDCNEAQEKMMDFVRGFMDIDDVEPFLEHTEHCRECYEELQISYCVYQGIRMLDEDSTDSFDIQHALDEYIAQSKEKLVRRRRGRRVLLVSVILLGWMLLVLFALYSGANLLN